MLGRLFDAFGCNENDEQHSPSTSRRISVMFSLMVATWITIIVIGQVAVSVINNQSVTITLPSIHESLLVLCLGPYAINQLAKFREIWGNKQ